ncbi:MAG: hypothetical protein ABIE94_06835 [archaeon]
MIENEEDLPSHLNPDHPDFEEPEEMDREHEHKIHIFTAEALRQQTNLRPYSTIVGGRAPTQPYTPQVGRKVGVALREFLGVTPIKMKIEDQKPGEEEEKKEIKPFNRGSILTGGSPGVGVDVYAGIANYCRKCGDIDRFFILVPETYDYGCHESRIADYKVIASLLPRGELHDFHAGKDPLERDKILGEISDVMIAVNGSEGTMEEVLVALQNGNPVITLPYTGGVAYLLAEAGQGRIPDEGELIFDTGDMLEKARPQLEQILESTDYRNLLHVADSTEEMIKKLEGLYGNLVLQVKRDEENLRISRRTQEPTYVE